MKEIWNDHKNRVLKIVEEQIDELICDKIIQSFDQKLIKKIKKISNVAIEIEDIVQKKFEGNVYEKMKTAGIQDFIEMMIEYNQINRVIFGKSLSEFSLDSLAKTALKWPFEFREFLAEHIVKKILAADLENINMLCKFAERIPEFDNVLQIFIWSIDNPEIQKLHHTILRIVPEFKTIRLLRDYLKGIILKYTNNNTRIIAISSGILSQEFRFGDTSPLIDLNNETNKFEYLGMLVEIKYIKASIILTSLQFDLLNSVIDERVVLTDKKDHLTIESLLRSSVLIKDQNGKIKFNSLIGNDTKTYRPYLHIILKKPDSYDIENTHFTNLEIHETVIQVFVFPSFLGTYHKYSEKGAALLCWLFENFN